MKVNKLYKYYLPLLLPLLIGTLIDQLAEGRSQKKFLPPAPIASSQTVPAVIPLELTQQLASDQGLQKVEVFREESQRLWMKKIYRDGRIAYQLAPIKEN